MPSFEPETIEAWRQARIDRSLVPAGMTEEQVRISLKNIHDDIREETQRLTQALVQVNKSRGNLASLTRMRETLLRLYGV